MSVFVKFWGSGFMKEAYFVYEIFSSVPIDAHPI